MVQALQWVLFAYTGIDSTHMWIAKYNASPNTFETAAFPSDTSVPTTSVP